MSKQIEEVFGKESFYKVFYIIINQKKILEIPENATNSEIKKAYFKKALKYVFLIQISYQHPDKNTDKNATKIFQALSLIHNALTDKNKRKFYDKHHYLEDDDINEDEFNNWYEYWRNLFPAFDEKDINSFSEKYKGSIDEKNDLIQSYIKNKGDMNKILEEIILSNEDDVKRFKEIIDNEIMNSIFDI